MIQFLLLPGLGADGRLGYAQQSLPYKVITPDCIIPFVREPLASYSKRFLDHLLETKAINLDEPLVLAGISFGGAIAQEMSRLIPSKAVILIGSLRNGMEMRPFIHFYGVYLTHIVPMWVLEREVRKLPRDLRALSDISEEDIQLSARMYADLSKIIFREGIWMLAKWEGCDVPVPTFRIHGANDHIIPFERTTGVDLVIQNVKHLVSLSARDEVNAAIIKYIGSNLGLA